MDKYYYIVASLPFLKFNEKTYLNRESFLAEASKWLTASDFNILSKVDVDDFYFRRGDCELLREYKNFESALRQEIALTRKAQEKEKPAELLKSYLLEGSPLGIEKKLLKFRWDFIEEKEQDNYFNLEFLIMYFLKLQILERLFTFDKDKGTAAFDALSQVPNDKLKEKLWQNA